MIVISYPSVQAEQAQQEACEKFEAMSAKAKEELVDFKKRRVIAFKKNLIDLSELEIKHSKVNFLIFSFIIYHGWFWRERLCRLKKSFLHIL